jgi:mevalonate kinase
MEHSQMEYYSHGKIILSGEYLVLQGGKALALPLKLGQALHISPNSNGLILWESTDPNGLFFTAAFQLNSLNIIESTHPEKALYIQNLLLAAKSMQANFLNNNLGYKIQAKLEFNAQWGLGSSSTLITNVANWAQIDAFALNRRISKGSGYDIACALADNPIIYQLTDHLPELTNTLFKPSFLNQLNLVYLNKKMPTEAHIGQYLKIENLNNSLIEQGNQLSEQMLHCKQLSDFQQLIQEHELLIGNLIHKSPVQKKRFHDFNGAIKSLGAWGGDFVLTASSMPFLEQKQYFSRKGYETIRPLSELILQK